MALAHYVGRFAPTPSGPLHFGSLVAALASYLEAKTHQGQWHLRIDDIDPPRLVPSAIDSILFTLDRYQLHWDGDVVYQSTRLERYADAFDTLKQRGVIYPCECTRKSLAGKTHTTRCIPSQYDDVAWRIQAPKGAGLLDDALQGAYAFDWQRDIGDFVVKRRDQLWSYQLANVVDDADMGVTHIVRGIDLIDSSARQYALIEALNYPLPRYAHLPIAVSANGDKLSKQTHATAIDHQTPSAHLYQALLWLRQQPPAELMYVTPGEILAWATAHWHLHSLDGLTQQSSPI